MKEREINCKNGKNDGITRSWGTDDTLFAECIYEDGYPKEGKVYVLIDRDTGDLILNVYKDFKLINQELRVPLLPEQYMLKKP